MTDALPSPREKAFSVWCVMQHARPVLAQALRAWGLQDAATSIEATHSLNALKLTVLDAYEIVMRSIYFWPVRRDLSKALNTLHAAATFASRGDSTNTAAIVIGVFTGAGGALAWRKPWQRFGWRQRRAQIIAAARHEQQLKLDGEA